MAYSRVHLETTAAFSRRGGFDVPEFVPTNPGHTWCILPLSRIREGAMEDAVSGSLSRPVPSNGPLLLNPG